MRCHGSLAALSCRTHPYTPNFSISLLYCLPQLQSLHGYLSKLQVIERPKPAAVLSDLSAPLAQTLEMKRRDAGMDRGR